MLVACRFRLTGPESAFWLMALLALLWRVAVPVGFMPEQRHAGWVLRLCTGEGISTVAIDLGGNPARSDGTAQPTPTTCAFAGPGTSVLPAAPAVLLAFVAAFATAAPRVTATEPDPRPGGRLRPPLRAPPVA
jgi:hypothetical protein